MKNEFTAVVERDGRVRLARDYEHAAQDHDVEA